jgi:hypothetical protein
MYPFNYRLSIQCYNLVKNGQFQEGLTHWLDLSPSDCMIKSNHETTIEPANTLYFPVTLKAIADGWDAATIPVQGQDGDPMCDLTQEISFNAGIGNEVQIAYLSWVDRVTSQGNNLDEEYQYASFSVAVQDNMGGVADTTIFNTAYDDFSTDTQTFQRIADIGDLLSNMILPNGYLDVSITLKERAYDWPMYFQLDQVELWVCFTEPTPDPRVKGDPHLTTWKGHHFTYNGACDLVFLHSDKFGDGLGIDIHLRTKHRRQFSYVSDTAVRIGADILEVSGRRYYLNGIEMADLPTTLGGFTVRYKKVDEKKGMYTIDLKEHGKILISNWKDFLTVAIEHGSSEYFADSIGLLGDYFNGNMLARDGVTRMEDNVDAFGQEWMVQPHEPLLFQKMGEKLEQCLMPSVQSDKRRRRLGATMSVEAATKACAHVNAEDLEFCIYDVMSTNDVDMAGAY